jgi:hypothetical protein
MQLTKNKNTRSSVSFKVISQDHTKPDNIHFGVKVLSSGKIKIIPVKKLFYQDEWLSGFSLSDIRMIAKIHAQSEWYRDKAQIAKNKETAKKAK